MHVRREHRLGKSFALAGLPLHPGSPAHQPSPRARRTRQEERNDPPGLGTVYIVVQCMTIRLYILAMN
jgi:hypothetical protein